MRRNKLEAVMMIIQKKSKRKTVKKVVGWDQY